MFFPKWRTRIVHIRHAISLSGLSGCSVSVLAVRPFFLFIIKSVIFFTAADSSPLAHMKITGSCHSHSFRCLPGSAPPGYFNIQFVPIMFMDIIYMFYLHISEMKACAGLQGSEPQINIHLTQLVNISQRQPDQPADRCDVQAPIYRINYRFQIISDSCPVI